MFSFNNNASYFMRLTTAYCAKEAGQVILSDVRTYPLTGCKILWKLITPTLDLARFLNF